MAALLDVQDLKVYFRKNGAVSKAVDGVSFAVGEGETLGLVGESGCGKSVTSLSIMRLVACPPAEFAGGKILYRGDDIVQMGEHRLRGIRGKEIAMIFQEPMSSLNPVFTAGYQIAEMLTTHTSMGKKEIREKVLSLLRKVEIDQPERVYKSYPHELSGGMRQRVMIAMAVACEPKLLIADEPTTALDVTIQAQILKLFRRLKEEFHMSLLLITHNLGLVSDLADRIAVMYAGIIAETGRTRDIFEAPLHPYTQGLIRSVPKLGERKARLETIPGMVPDAARKPAGCPFHPRCYLKGDICAKELPVLREVRPGHFAACHFAK
ncbi:MAG TPA: ABC transporter ATP-binding protein [bacterium]|nr:ABC transporter ATP-binding protein [bacterium]